MADRVVVKFSVPVTVSDDFVEVGRLRFDLCDDCSLDIGDIVVSLVIGGLIDLFGVDVDILDFDVMDD